MEFEWDEAKRVRTLLARNLDFEMAAYFFDGRLVFEAMSERSGEARWKRVAEIDGKFVTLIWTEREERIRVITMRRSHGSEERTYRAVHSGRTEGQARPG